MLHLYVKLSLVLLAGMAACPDQAHGQDAPSNPLSNRGELVLLANGFISTEGPVWHVESGSLFFSDIPGDTIYALDSLSNTVSIIRSPSNTANGLALSGSNTLLAAEQQTRIISEMDLDSGRVTPFAETVIDAGSERKFNSPNDMAVHSTGIVYFTDPPFGLRGREGERELAFNGVFMRRSDGSTQTIKTFPVGTNPNGIILSPDEATLYLAISDDESGPILAFNVDADGRLSNEREFSRGQNTDGMAVDTEGNLYVATRSGIDVWSPSGQYWGKITLPGNLRTTNCAFGGAEMNTLYITSRSDTLYSLTLDVIGHAPSFR